MSTWNKNQLVNATEEDCNLLFEWTNDTDVRKNSFNSNVITYENHIKWFEGKLQSDDSHIFIFKVNNMSIGMIRLDRKKDNTYFINYSIDKKYRGQGYATDLLSIIKTKYSDDLLIGEVKKDNIASMKAFIKADYIMKEDDERYIFYSHNR